MIGILVVTHGNLGSELIKSAAMIIGMHQELDCLGLYQNDSVSALQQAIKEKVASLDQGQGVLILTDIFGGSTSNSVALALRDRNYACVTGVNLPMLIEAVLCRDECELPELKEQCLRVGAEAVKDLAATMELEMPV